MFRSRGGVLSQALMLVAIVTAVMGACIRRPPPPPRQITQAVWRAAVVAYAQKREFATLFPASDTATYVSGTDTTRITLSPLTAAGQIPDDQLHEGWIIGRTVGSGVNLPLGIPVGTGYVWVDSVDGAWRLIHIPENAADSLRVRRVIFGDKPFKANQAARVLLSRIALASNWRCGSRCCIEGGDGQGDDFLRALVDTMHSAVYPPR